METGKITEIWISYNYWFYNWWYIKYKIRKKEHYWHSTDRLIEEFCMKIWIYKEDDMQKLKNKRFKILDYEYFDEWWVRFEVELINKKINPEKKTFNLYSAIY